MAVKHFKKRGPTRVFYFGVIKELKTLKDRRKNHTTYMRVKKFTCKVEK